MVTNEEEKIKGSGWYFTVSYFGNFHNFFVITIVNFLIIEKSCCVNLHLHQGSFVFLMKVSDSKFLS